ncbi:MAG: serine hydroxymethyltransferase, partial [candidate division Zixibacteria bacterium]|nr:serine hydroxymethyltransferase [candidate division Zixibacteria bacterium]NIS45761.1 serine hydroxymethyltransferase [candidate division Zixibacteria bacterium]NIU13881.1 serine hydroxymethyltransferase [candidate division Zixibacteria bacterium]NIV05931.1 serine hydroxymethyltransferase [candidate division Zixibacteria bacterium]NIW44701.1 serine hydroxymethyltransferase [Gammaproteobacteria bacterium]
NRNTIPGDKSARKPSGIRLGTPWISQRGFTESMVEELGQTIVDLLQNIQPYYQGSNLRAKIGFA